MTGIQTCALPICFPVTIGGGASGGGAGSTTGAPMGATGAAGAGSAADPNAQLQAWDKTLAIHYLIILASTALFMSSYKIFGFFNSQYEIREMFVVLASIGYVIYLFGKSR